MRLSIKLFTALAVLAGALLGFSPDASAHRNTGSSAAVTGNVHWGAGACPGSITGLPLGDPGAVPPVAYTAPDCVFNFGNPPLVITSAGLWDGMNHATTFTCVAGGINGASGNDKGAPIPPPALPDTQQIALGPTFGAFTGEFECTGAAPIPGKYNLPGSVGSFQGLSVGSTTIGFLGPIACADAVGANTCPLGAGTPAGNQATTNGGNYTSLAATPAGHVTPAGYQPGDHNVSGINHTLACKGEVVPNAATLVVGGNFSGTDIAVADAAVALECIIA